jgi:hypothetical protein
MRKKEGRSNGYILKISVSEPILAFGLFVLAVAQLTSRRVALGWERTGSWSI